MSRSVRGLFSTFLIYAAVAICTWPILTASKGLYPGGIDALGHLSKVEQVALKWRKGDFSDWYPLWYNGATAVQYYPLLAVWVSAVIQCLVRNIATTFRIFNAGCLCLSGFTAACLYRKGNRLWRGPSCSL